MVDNRLVAIWVPDWPVLAAISQEKLSAHEPVATVDARQVTAVSQVARGRGVQRGMRLRTARAVCPEVIFVSDDPAREARLFEQVASAVEEVAVGAEIVRPGVLVCPAAGPLKHWKNDEVLAEELITSIAHHIGWESAVGIGEGLLGAVSAARRGQLLAVGQTTTFLKPLPVGELLAVGIADKDQQVPLRELVDLLQRLGIRTLGQLADLKAGDVFARFGVVGQWAQRLITNELPKQRAARGGPQEIAAHIDIDPPAQQVDQAAFAARQVATQLHGKLTSAGQMCARIHILVRSELGTELQRTWRHEGELSESGMTDRVRWQLEGWISGRSGQTPDAGLTYLELRALDLLSGENSQGHLWGVSSKKDQRAHRALTRVQHLLGSTGVFLPVLEGGRDPGEQVRLVAWGDEVSALRDPNLPWPGQLPKPNPTLVYARPITVVITDSNGQGVKISSRGEISAPPQWLVAVPEKSAVGSTAKPNSIELAGRPEKLAGRPERKQRITGWAGPWFVAQQWWEGKLPRARFQFLLEDQHAVLVACRGQEWAVEASYD